MSFAVRLAYRKSIDRPTRAAVSRLAHEGRRWGVRAAGAAAILLALSGSTARADFPSDVPDRFKIQFGGMNAQFVTQGSLSVTDGPAGVFVNFEDVFDLPVSKHACTVEGFTRVHTKGYVEFGYVDFDRTAAHIIEQDIEWGDHTFLANARVEANFSTQFIYAAYRHDFLQLEQVHISGSAGFSYLNLGAGVGANGNVLDSNGNPVSGSFKQETNVGFPVPLLGLQLDWRLTKHTAIQMYNRTLYVDAQNFRGGISTTAIRYEWYATRHFAIGGGLDKYSINLRKYTTGNFTARFEYEARGPELYLKMAF